MPSELLNPVSPPSVIGDTEGDRVASGVNDSDRLGESAGEVKLESWLTGVRGKDETESAFWLEFVEYEAP